MARIVAAFVTGASPARFASPLKLTPAFCIGEVLGGKDAAGDLEELGAPTDRATVARTENGTRRLSLDDALLYCVAIAAPFLSMVAITDDGAPVAVTPKESVSPYGCRA